MRTFMARAGKFLCVIASLVWLPAGSLLAEGEAVAEKSDSDRLGLGVFSRLPLTISTSVSGGYDDNVDTTPGAGQASWFTTIGVLVNWTIGTDRTQMSLGWTTGFTYYSDTSNNNFEPNLNLTLSLAHKISPRLQLGVSAVINYEAEPSFQYGLGTNRRAGNYFFTSDKISANYVWVPRFSTSTSYSFVAVNYDDIATGLFEDRIENTIGNEFRFLVWPTTNVVGEYRFQAVSYLHEGDVITPATPTTPAVLLERDSTTHFLLVGFDHAFGPRLNAVFRGGAEFRDYDMTGEKNSPYFEATVGYKLGKDTSLSWNANYGIEEGDVGTNPTRQSFRTGISGKYNITARVSASLSLYYYHDAYDQTVVPNPVPPPTTLVNPSFVEESINFELSLRYAVTRYLGVEAGYYYTDVSSGQPFRDYSRNRVWGGFNVVF